MPSNVVNERDGVRIAIETHVILYSLPPTVTGELTTVSVFATRTFFRRDVALPISTVTV
jgi:hypothetical protein